MPKLNNKTVLLIVLGLGVLRLVDTQLPSPAYAKLYLDLGEQAQKHKEYHRAIAYYNKTLAANKMSNKGYYRLALLYQELNDQDNMLKYFKKVVAIGSDVTNIKVNPYERRDIEYADACYYVGLDYKNQNNIPMAMRFFELSLNHYRPYPQSTYQLGLIYDQLNNKEKALEQVGLITKDASTIALGQKLKTILLNDHPDWR